jgi:hypothetical protein
VDMAGPGNTHPPPPAAERDLMQLSRARAKHTVVPLSSALFSVNWN